MNQLGKHPVLYHTPRQMIFLKRINSLLGYIETALLCLIVLLTIGMILLKVVLRHLFHTGIRYTVE